MLVPVHVLAESLFHIKVADVVPVCIPVQKAVAAHGIDGEDICAQRDIAVDGAAGAYAQHVEGTVLRLYLAGGEIYICQGVQFSHYNVYVVRAYSCGQDGDPLGIIPSGNGDELPGGVAALNVLKICCGHINPGRVSYHYNVVSQLLRLHMEVERGSVRVNYKFRFRYSHNSVS